MNLFEEFSPLCGALVDFNAQFDGRSLTTFEKGGRYLVDTGNVNVMQIFPFNSKGIICQCQCQ